jgi:hypothetical protein
MGFSTVTKPSESVRGVLRHKKEQKRGAGKGGEGSPKVAEIRDLLASIAKVYTAKAALQLTPLTTSTTPIYSPFSVKYPPHKVLIGFFQ